jgi:hypothetical protein
VRGFLELPSRRRRFDGSPLESVYILIDQPDIPAVTRDAILKVDVLEELSAEERGAVAESIKKTMART